MEMERSKVTPLWKMSLMKLESMFSSGKEFSVFMNKYPSLNRSGKFILSEQIEYERELKSSSKYISPSLTYFEVSKNSKFSSMTLEPDDVPHSLEILSPCFGISDERIVCLLDDRKNEFYEKCTNSYFGLEKEIEMPGDEFGRDTISISQNLESSAILSSGDIAPSLDIRKNSSSKETDESNLPLKEVNNEHESEIIASDFTIASCNCDFCRNVFNKCLPSSLEVQKDNFSEESDETCLPLKEASKIEAISAFDFTITSYYCDSCDDVSCKNISSCSELQKDHFSEEFDEDFPLKEETDQHRSKLTAYDFYSRREMSSKCISSNLGMQRNKSDESIQINHDIETANYFPENECSQEKMRTSFENSEEASNYFNEKTDLINAERLKNQFLYSTKYATGSNLVQEEKLPKGKDSEPQKDHSEDYWRTSILGEAKQLLKCEVSKIQNEYLEESAIGNYPTEECIYLKLREKSEIREEHFQGIHADERENDFLKNEYSKEKIDYSSEKTRKYDALDNDCLLEMCSAFDFICKIEENASSCMEKQNLLSKTLIKSEDIHSEPYCVKSVPILLYFLDDVRRDLQSKKDMASKLKFDSEAKVKELNSYDLENNKEGKELKETANNFVSRCDEVCASIEKDRVECELYSKNLKKMLNFFQ